MVELFTRMAEAARADPEVATHVRDGLAESGLLAVFGEGQTLDVVDLLDAGGEEALRARLMQMTLGELKQIVAARQYDPEKETPRLRTPPTTREPTITTARQQLAKPLPPP